MDNFGNFDTAEEIRNEILSQVNKFETIRKAKINCRCASETQFLNVLEELVSEGFVSVNETFIFKK